MGLFDFFLSIEAKTKKHQRWATDPDLVPEDREASCKWLAEQGTPAALIALLSRFDMNLSHQLHDKQEKEWTLALLLKKGDAVEVPTRAWLKQCKQIAWPLRLLGELRGRDAAVEAALAQLNVEREKADLQAGKKHALLVWLSDQRHPGCVSAAAPLLRDFDEGVRISAAEVMLAQNDPSAREPLLAALANPEEESNRLKVRILEAFASKRWPVGEVPLPQLPSPFRIVNGQVQA